MYYSIIMTAVFLFSIQFLFNQRYQKECGNRVRASLIFSSGFSIAGLFVLLIINGFHFEFTLFTALIAGIAAINNMVANFCSLKAFGKINLSLYSTISMLGGMLLPFLAGIIFFNEKITLGKVLCVIIITTALFLTSEFGSKSSEGKYYIGIFVLNGMAGVISKIFKAAPFPKTGDAGYSILTASATLIFSLLLLIFIRGEKMNVSKTAIGSMIGAGMLNNIANFFLLISLSHIPASAQYPMVTGGVMISSTIISYITRQKPNKKEVGAVILSFIGILALVLIP